MVFKLDAILGSISFLEELCLQCFLKQSRIIHRIGGQLVTHSKVQGPLLQMLYHHSFLVLFLELLGRNFQKT